MFFKKKGRRVLNYFDKELENKASDSSPSKLPKEIFWLDTIKRKKQVSILSSAMMLSAALVLLFSMILLSNSLLGRGWLKQYLKSNKQSSKTIEVTIPVVEKPKLEGDGNYNSDGSYTVKGVAAVVSDSVVSIYAMPSDDLMFTGGQGSGFVFTSDGYIVTNAHVVTGTENPVIKVKLNGGVEYYSAAVVGIDVVTDIAVIKIEKSGLTPVVFSDSRDVAVGEEVVAIGCPAGLEGTVTDGIVSGLDRSITVESVSVPGCIQVDAAINHGNSGGPLVNMWGQVVGIVSAKLETGEYDGIAFAISSEVALPVIENLLEHGCVPGRVKIGITFYELDEQSAKEMNTVAGLYIAEVLSDCDIINSGLEPGDVITKMDGVEVRTAEDVSKILENHFAGDEIDFTYVDPEGNSFDSSFKLMDNQQALIVKK